MKGINVHITDATHQKLNYIKTTLRKSNLADALTSLIENYYTSLNPQTESDPKIPLNYDKKRGEQS